jgi:outer membrane protein TolC
MRGIGIFRAGAALGALLMLTLCAKVSGAQVVTLEELEMLALQNQASWGIAEAHSREAEAHMALAKAGRRPSFGLDANGAVAPGSQVVEVATLEGKTATVRSAPPIGSPTAFRANAVYDATLSMNAPLYDFGRTKAAIQAAETKETASSAWGAQTNDELLREVRADYLGWLHAHALHQWAVESSADAQAQRNRVAQRVQDGDRPGSDLTAAQQQALEQQLLATDSKAELDRARRRLEQTVGASLTASAEPDGRLLELPSRDSDDEPPRASEAEALERESEAARLQARTLRKSRAPVLAATLQTGLRGVDNDVFPGYRLGLNLALPLWDGGKTVAEAELSEALAMELSAQAAQSRSAMESAQKQAQADRESAEAQLPLAEELVAVSEERVEQAEASYELGVGELDDIAVARAALRDAKSRLVRVQVARAEAILRASSH